MGDLCRVFNGQMDCKVEFCVRFVMDCWTIKGDLCTVLMDSWTVNGRCVYIF
jgi:hypothetical protein